MVDNEIIEGVCEAFAEIIVNRKREGVVLWAYRLAEPREPFDNQDEPLLGRQLFYQLSQAR